MSDEKQQQYYDLNAARKHGISDADILNELAKTHNYDLAGAREHGISDDQILSTLVATKPPAEPVIEKEMPEVFGGIGGAAAAAATAADTVYSKGRGIYRGLEKSFGKLAGQESRDPVSKVKPFLSPSQVAEQAIERRMPADIVPEGSTTTVRNWAVGKPGAGTGQHAGEFLGGSEYGEADKIKKEALAFEKQNPTQKVLPGSLLAVPEEESKRLAQQKAALAAEQDKINQAEVDKVAQTRADRLGKRAAIKGSELKLNTAKTILNPAANIVGGYQLGSQGAQAYNRLTRPDLTASDIASGATNVLGAGAGAAAMGLPDANIKFKGIPIPVKPIASAISTGASFLADLLDKRNPRDEDTEKKAQGGLIHLADGGGPKLPGKFGKFQKVASKILKASEALGAHEGKKLGLTQTDNFGVHGGRMGGNRFPDFQNTSPIHQRDQVVWMNDSEKHARDMVNRGGPDTIWSTYIGSPDQLKSNKSVFNDILQQHYKRELTPEQIELINKRIGTLAKDPKKGTLMFPQSFDIRDKFAAQELGGDTFDRRAALAEILGEGKGVKGTKAGIAMPEYQDILRSHRDPLTEGVPTSSVGTRLFNVDRDTPTKFSQEYHPDYNWTVHGKDTGVQFEQPVPQRLAVPDWYNEINARAPGKTHGNAWFSYMKEPQVITEEMLTKMQKEGYADGGLVYLAKGGSPDAPWNQKVVPNPEDLMGTFSYAPGYYGEVADNINPEGKTAGANDAIRHMLASGDIARRVNNPIRNSGLSRITPGGIPLVSENVGPAVAQGLGWGHEMMNYIQNIGGKKPQTNEDLAQDLHNNKVGAELGKNANSFQDLINKMPNATNVRPYQKEKGKALIRHSDETGTPYKPFKWF
jgi:hypothetical protein